MFAVETLSTGTQAVLFFVAFVAFVVAAVIAVTRRSLEAALIPAGLAAWVFVAFWNTLAGS